MREPGPREVENTVANQTHQGPGHAILNRSHDLRRITAVTAVVAMAGTCFTAEANGKVSMVEFKDLAARSDLIVIATVSKVEDGPASLKGIDTGMPALKVATAQVVETWKGEPVREIRYVASPSWVCDTSFAKKGERVVLFLEKVKDSPFLTITHAGRGRMPHHDVKGRTYATLQDEVVLPEGTPTISEEKTAQLPLPSTEPGKPASPPLTFTYSVASIELGVLRDMVRASHLAPARSHDKPNPKVIDATQAVRIAEQFVRENGYTDFVPEDISKLTPESIERWEREGWIAHRHKTLRPHALGYLRGGKNDPNGWTVGFERVKPSRDQGVGRAVTMGGHGEGLMIQHKDFFLKNLEPRPE
jgi:hypothetical protein